MKGVSQDLTARFDDRPFPLAGGAALESVVSSADGLDCDHNRLNTTQERRRSVLVITNLARYLEGDFEADVG